MSFKITGDIVRADFNAVESVLHYARATERLGLWASEREMIRRTFPDPKVPLLEAGCGAGRVTLGLWDMGYRRIVAFDFAKDLLEQAESFAQQRGARSVRLHLADATTLEENRAIRNASCDGVLFLFNGLMQIPGRERRRAALRGLWSKARFNSPLLFTTHDRDDEPVERRHWQRQAELWAKGDQDPSLLEFGDRYFLDDNGYRVFMHLPSRAEILEDLAATGWQHEFDDMRRRIAAESRAVRDFSDECRFWVARKVDKKSG